MPGGAARWELSGETFASLLARFPSRVPHSTPISTLLPNTAFLFCILYWVENPESHPASASKNVFESLKSTIQDLLNGRVAPTDRRAAIYEMKRALVSAKLGVEDLREGVEITRRKLDTEREQLATVQRRKTLAEGINDAETVALAVKYEQQHGEHVAVLGRKLEAQEAEAELAERELAGMMSQLKAANAGVGSNTDPTGTHAGGISDEELGLPDDSKLHAELDNLARANRRSAADADAEAKLAELKKRMGQ